jgi:ABC-type multidrug transport system, permease component
MSRRVEQLFSMIHKEMLQVVRDPSCILIALVLPLILLFIFGYGVSLDARNVRTAIVSEDRGPLAESLFHSLKSTDYINAIYYTDRHEAQKAMIRAEVRGILIIPSDFTRNLERNHAATAQLLTDGCETNTATILENYILGTVNKWSSHMTNDMKISIPTIVNIHSRVHFNPELNTRNTLIPGSIVVIMAIIGTLLTALVVAREWERGTMEAMLTMPIRKIDMIIGKLFPYYLLGLGAMVVCVLVSRYLFGVPFRGSVPALLMVSTIFLIAALAQGFFISTITKNQFLASQIALMFAFLPNFMLSGALFEISSMPLPIRCLTYIFPARYYVTAIQTIFMVGDVWPLLIWCIACMSVIASVVLVAAFLVTPRRL